ncbi:MAG: TonB family protein [Acidobacteria bacterium]|nr:TonB family protein [Acidobacteriota bacterium]
MTLVLAVTVLSAQAQTEQPAAQTDVEAMQKRIRHARALTAAHNLTAAAFELDAIRNSTTDEAVRDVARIMLMGIYLEQGDYGRAQNLLEETYKARTPQNEGSTRSYFAVAGQTMNGVREHLGRYRAFGLNITDKDLPTEATNDLDRMRVLLERVAEQAKEIGAGDDKNTDAFALLEDVANVRSSLSRDMDERARWQGEVADARQHLTASDSRLVSLSSSGVAAASPSPALTASKTGITNPPPAPASASTNSNAPAANPPAKTEAAKNDAASDAPANAQAGATTTGELLNVGSLLERATQKVSPTYPAFAKTAHVSGIVRVELVVDEKGYVVSAQSSTGPAMLRQAAIDAAKRWKFRPTMTDGQPVRVTGFLNFNFTAQ